MELERLFDYSNLHKGSWRLHSSSQQVRDTLMLSAVAFCSKYMSGLHPAASSLHSIFSVIVTARKSCRESNQEESCEIIL